MGGMRRSVNNLFIRHVFKQCRTIILYAQVTQNKILLINNKVISPLFFLFCNIFILSLFIDYEKKMRLRGESVIKDLYKNEGLLRYVDYYSIIRTVSSYMIIDT